MKSKEIAKGHGLNRVDFDNWIKRSGYAHKASAMGGVDVDDSQDINEMVSRFKQDAAEGERAAQEAEAERLAAAQKAEAERQAAAQNKQQALARMLITSGFSFDGYTITRYSGYISGDDAVQVPRTGGLWGKPTHVGDALMKSLVTIRRNALAELKEAAHALGCNAVIGVDFDYLTLDPQHGVSLNNQGTVYEPYVFGVTANGNAVVIEKNENSGSRERGRADQVGA